MYSPSYIQRALGFLPGVKRPWPEVDPTPLSSVEFKDEWSYAYNPLIHLHEVCRDNDMSGGVDTSLIPPPR